MLKLKRLFFYGNKKVNNAYTIIKNVYLISLRIFRRFAFKNACYTPIICGQTWRKIIKKGEFTFFRSERRISITFEKLKQKKKVRGEVQGRKEKTFTKAVRINLNEKINPF